MAKVAGSIPAFRTKAVVAQQVEHHVANVKAKGSVGSIPADRSKLHFGEKQNAKNSQF
jgi:hypothetical protein